MIRPLGSQVLLQQLPQEKMAGPFHLPNRYQIEQLTHIVLATGPKVTPELLPGMRVLLDQYSINSRCDCGQNQWLLKEEHLALAW